MAGFPVYLALLELEDNKDPPLGECGIMTKKNTIKALSLTLSLNYTVQKFRLSNAR